MNEMIAIRMEMLHANGLPLHECRQGGISHRSAHSNDSVHAQQLQQRVDCAQCGAGFGVKRLGNAARQRPIDAQKRVRTDEIWSSVRAHSIRR